MAIGRLGKKRPGMRFSKKKSLLLNLNMIIGPWQRRTIALICRQPIWIRFSQTPKSLAVRSFGWTERETRGWIRWTISLDFSRWITRHFASPCRGSRGGRTNHKQKETPPDGRWMEGLGFWRSRSLAERRETQDLWISGGFWESSVAAWRGRNPQGFQSTGWIPFRRDQILSGLQDSWISRRPSGSLAKVS